MVNLFWERFYNSCALRGTKPNPVAKEIGISSGIITKWKNNSTLPNGETLIKIADYLDCSIDYLLGRTDVPEVNRGTDYGYPLQYAKMAAATGHQLENVLAPDEITELRALEEYHKHKNGGK